MRLEGKKRKGSSSVDTIGDSVKTQSIVVMAERKHGMACRSGRDMDGKKKSPREKKEEKKVKPIGKSINVGTGKG